MKWYELCVNQSPRLKLLSEFLNQSGIANELVTVECTHENLKEKIEIAKKDLAPIRFTREIFDVVVPHIGSVQTELEVLKSIDCLFLDKTYWPDNLFRESLFHFMTLKFKKIDVTQKALVLGSCGLSRAVIAGLIRLGFSKINISSQNEELGKKLITDLNKIFFNMSFEFTPRDRLTLLPGIHGLVVNSYSFAEAAEYLNEIYYFNFLKKGGYAVDLNETPPETPFLHVAKDIGAHVIYGYEVMAYYDLHWAERVFQKKVDLRAYSDFLRQNLEKVPYDKEKYKKVLVEFQI